MAARARDPEAADLMPQAKRRRNEGAGPPGPVSGSDTEVDDGASGSDSEPAATIAFMPFSPAGRPPGVTSVCGIVASITGPTASPARSRVMKRMLLVTAYDGVGVTWRIALMAKVDGALLDAARVVKAGMLVFAHRANVTDTAVDPNPVADLWIGGASHKREGSFVAFWPRLLGGSDLTDPATLRQISRLDAHIVSESTCAIVVPRHAALCCVSASGSAQDIAKRANEDRAPPSQSCDHGVTAADALRQLYSAAENGRDASMLAFQRPALGAFFFHKS